MIELEVDLPGRPPTPNARYSRNVFVRSRSRKQWREWARLVALVALRDSGRADDFPLERASIEPTFFVRVRRGRDDDNLVASLKPLIDGLVDAGVLVDDSSDRVTIAKPVVQVMKYSGVRLYIREVEA